MTPLFTANQEMFFVILTLVFIVAIIGDFSKARLFRSIGRMPDTRNELDKATKLFMILLVVFMAWAQDKDSLRSSGNGDWLSGEALEAIESEYSYSLMEEESGITWALLTGNPPFTSNAVLTASQFQAGFACASVTGIQPSALAAPANAVTFTNWPYAVARQAVLLPQGCLPEGFTFGGRPVTNLYMAASGMLSFDGPKSSPIPATNGIPDGTAVNYIAVLQTPSDIVPTNGIFWYATGTNSSVFTWKDAFLGQDTNCLATVQAELYANGDFTCRYSFPSPTYSYSSIPDGVLIGAQNNPGGETVLHTNNLLAVHSAFMSAFELRWKSLAGLNPAVADQDDDSLATADELFIHRTDPRRKDSDGDGISDPAEIAAMTDPLNPDTNNDGIPDGIDLTGYSLSDTNLVFKLINNIAPSVDPNLDTDNDGWADWLEQRFGTDPNYFYSTPDGLDNLFSVTVTLATPPPETGVLAVGTNRVMVTGPGSWTFWRTPGEAHPVSFTSPHGVPPSFQITLNRPDASRYDSPAPDGSEGDFGKVALPLISFDPEIGRCCHEARTEAHCQTYTAYVMPPMPGAYAYDVDGTWSTNAPNVVSAGHDVNWLRLRFTAAGALAYREAWAWINVHCANFIPLSLEGAGGTHIIYANTDNDDGDGLTDNEDNYVNNEDDLRAVTPYTPPQSCCLCPSHSPTNWVCGIEAVSDNLRVYEVSNKTSRIFQGHQIDQAQTVYVEGLVSSSTSQVDYVDWKMEGMTDDGSGGLTPTNIIIRSVYTVIDLKAAPVRLEPVTTDANEQGLILNPCGVATNGLTMYKVDVVPPGIVPDSAIHWSIASGDVSFYQSHDTGRTAIIRGGDTPESNFKLEVQIDGLPSTYKPFIFGKVLAPKTVQIRAYVICDTNGVAAVSANTITNWVAEANRIYRQVAMTFTVASISNVTDRTDWFEIENDNEITQMFSYVDVNSGLELYCVKSINGALGKSTTPQTSGVTEGLTVSSDAFLNTLAHEIGHSCGLMHVDTEGYGDGLVAENLVESPNWSGGSETGYYEPTLKYRDLTPRIIMSTTGGNSRAEIPLYGVQGMYQGTLFLMSVGLQQMTTREPEH
jgi:hypothetical protein